MAGVHSRARSFDGVARSYELGRPGWPPEAVGIAARRLGLGRDAAVLDLAVALRAILARHGVREAELTYRTEVTTARG